jgi:hypothetical protein
MGQQVVPRRVIWISHQPACSVEYQPSPDTLSCPGRVHLQISYPSSSCPRMLIRTRVGTDLVILTGLFELGF